MTKHVIELIRVSTEGQAAEDRAGIPAQRSVNRSTARAYGLQIVRTVEMADVSGTAVLHAPEMQELLELIKSPEIHGVVAREFSRLMRPENFEDFALLQAFANSKTMLYLPDGPIDFSSKSGRLMGGIRALIAGLERTEILERIWNAKEEKRRAGQFAQSAVCLPYGVGYSRDRGWYYKPEAEKVRDAYRRFLAGEMDYSAIADLLGVTHRGAHLILRNPIWKGWRVIDKKRDMGAGVKHSTAQGRQADRPKVKRAEDEVIRVKVLEGIISEDEWQRTQDLMDVKQAKHWRSNPRYEQRYIYNGHLVCAECGDLVYTSHRRTDYYVCKKKKTGERCETTYMRRDRLEPALDSLLSDRLTDRHFLEDVTSAWQESAAKPRRDSVTTARLTRELQNISQKRERVLQTFYEGLIDRDALHRLLAGLEKEKSTYASLLQEPPTPRLSAESLVEVFEPFYEWKFLSRDDKRQLLKTLVPEIHVANYRIAGVQLSGAAVCGNDGTRMGKDSSPPPA